MLTKDQFIELKNKGLSLEQIASFEGGFKPTKEITGQNPYKGTSSLARVGSGFVQGLSNFGVGLGTEIGKQSLGMGQALLKTGIAASKATGIGKTDFAEETVNQLESLKQNLYEKPFEKVTSTPTGKIGQAVGVVAPYLSGSYTAPVTSAQSFLKGASGELLKNAPGVVKATARVASQAIPEAVGAGALEYGVSGGDIEKAKETAKFVGATSAVLGAGGEIYRSLFAPETKTAAIKGLGIQGKVKASETQRLGENYTDGLKVTVDNSKGLKIKSLDGTEKVFDPATADYNDTIQAWEHAREQVYSKYHKLAQEAGTLDTSKSLAQLDDTLQQMAKQPRTATFKAAVKSVLRDIRENFAIMTDEGIPQYQNVSAESLETFLKDLNKQGATVFSGTGDKALGEVSANTAGFIRKFMDDAIETSGGAGYQELRSQYAALKDIEKPLVAQWKRSAKKIGGGLGDYLGAYSSGDVVAGLMYANPQAVAAGISRNILLTTLKKLRDPERFLRKALSDIATTPSAEGFAGRVFGGSAEGSPAFQAGQNLVKGTKETIKNLPEETTNLGKRMVGTFRGYSSGKIIKSYLDEAANVVKDADYAGIIKANPRIFVDGVKEDITKALSEYGYTQEVKAINSIDTSKMKTFSEFKNALSKIGNDINPQSGFVSTGSGIPKELQPLAEEAKKYKSAEGFVKAQPIVYHGSESFSGGNLKLGVGEEYNSLGDGIYLTNDKVRAGAYGKVNEIYLDKNAKIFDGSNPKIQEMIRERINKGEDYPTIIRDLGFDGVRTDKGMMVIYKPEVLKTKPQLIDLYNKVRNGGSTNPNMLLKGAAVGAGLAGGVALMSKTKEPKQTKETPKQIQVRGETITNDEIQKAVPIIFAEVSNRPKDKQLLEVKVIINTVLNRMKEYAKAGKPKSFFEVLTMPNQYQGYDTSDPTSQYNLAVNKKLDELSNKKFLTVQNLIKSVLNGNLTDNTSGSFYYKHKPDGKIVVMPEKKLFAD